MSPDSLILVNDLVLPNTIVHSHATQLYMTRMTAMVATERKSEQWHRLIEEAKLTVKGVHVYTQSLKDSIIAIGLA